MQFKQTLRKALKYAVVELIGFGFHAMEIEDHYGDYQEIYYESKDSDLIVS